MITEQTETAIAVVERPAHALMRPVASPADLVGLHKEMTELIKTALVNGVDYGVIPGTDRAGGGKPTLLKPGAERIATAFGCFARYSIAEQEIDHDREVAWCKRKKRWEGKRYAGDEEQRGTSLGLYRYVIRCEIVKRSDGSVVADGIGSCSSMESKYIDRPRDTENTVLKMAEKRALVAAVLNGFGLSDRFAQDLEDTAEEEHAQPASGKPALASQSDLDRLAAIATHDQAPEKIRTWLADRLAKASRDGGLTAESAAKILGGLSPKVLALVPAVDADAMPEWMGQTPPTEAPVVEREPGQEG